MSVIFKMQAVVIFPLFGNSEYKWKNDDIQQKKTGPRLKPHRKKEEMSE